MNAHDRRPQVLVSGVCLLVLVFLGGCPGPAQNGDQGSEGRIEWIHSEAEGLALAKRENKPLIIDFYADWCAPCKMMDKKTFRDQRVVEELGRFVAVKADVSRPDSPGQPAAKKYNVTGYPTFVLIDTRGQKKSVVGYRPPDEFLKVVKSIH